MSTPALPGDPTAGDLGQLLPLSNELIASVLDAREFTHRLDDDGDIFGNWHGNLIYFFRIGEKREMLQVRALTATVFGIDQVSRLYEFCNSWNHDRLWPKAYVHVADDGSARVVGEVIADWEHGVTVAQIDQVMICGIATGCQLADAVAELENA
jgi:putative sensory transduction regulator